MPRTERIPDPFIEFVRDYIIELIEVHETEGTSSAELARLAKVSKSTVKRWRDRETLPDLDTAFRAIDRWGGNKVVPFMRAHRPDLAFLLQTCDEDKELLNLLLNLLQNDNPYVREQFKIYLNSFSKMLQVEKT